MEKQRSGKKVVGLGQHNYYMSNYFRNMRLESNFFFRLKRLSNDKWYKEQLIKDIGKLTKSIIK